MALENNKVFIVLFKNLRIFSAYKWLNNAKGIIALIHVHSKRYYRDSWIISKANSLPGNYGKVGNSKKNLNPL